MTFKIEFDGKLVAQVQTPAMVREICVLAKPGQLVRVSAPSGCRPEYIVCDMEHSRLLQACRIEHRAQLYLDTAGMVEGLE